MSRSLVFTVLCVFAVGLSSLVHAQVVTVEVNGQVTGATCNVSLDGSTNPLVTLPKVAATQLNEAGKTAGETTIILEMTGCNLTGGQRVTPIFFTPLSASGGRLSNLAPVDGAAVNVELELLYQGHPINLEGNLGDQGAGSAIISVPNGGAIMEYVVRYYATGQVQAGRVYSNMLWDVSYN